MYGKDRSGIGRAPLVDSEGKFITVPCGGKYADAALNGRLFYASTQTHVGTSTTKNNTFTGIALVNPATSGKVYIVHEFSWALDNSPAADTQLSLAVGPVHAGYAADLTVVCARYGYATSAAIVDTAATITGADLTIVKHMGTLGTNLTTDMLTWTPPVDLGGSIILDPGRVVATDSILASGAFLFLAFMWEEISV
jgi:hypothetical protein